MKLQELELLPEEKILFSSPFKERWLNTRWDLIGYITIGLGFIPYFLLAITILNITGFIRVFYPKDLYLLFSAFGTVSIIFLVATKYSIDILKVYKNNYPFVLTNKRILLEKYFIKKVNKEPFSIFIEGAEKVLFVETTKKASYVYFKKDGKIHRVPLPYLSKYKEDFKNSLKNLFGKKYTEINLWKLGVPLTKKIINEIFQEEKKENAGNLGK